jgi:hypothetical protein
MRKTGSRFGSDPQKEMRNVKMKERGKDRKGSRERARARSLATV